MRSLEFAFVRAAAIGALGASLPLFAQQFDPTLVDSSLAPPSVLLPQDLSIPVMEPVPAGGWPTEELDFGLSSLRGAEPETAPPLHTDGWSPGEKPDEGPAPHFASSLSIRELMTEPLVTNPGDGRVWVRNRNLRASFGEEGFTAHPVFGSRSPREWPVRFAVDAITLGGDSVGHEPTGPAVEAGGQVTIPRRGAREVYHLGLDEIEQTFVFDVLPGSGDLVVRMDVETDLSVVDGEEGLRFVHQVFGEVRYGDAFVLDAAGRREAIPRRWDGEHLTLTVPSEFLAEATLPVTIDPPVTAFASSFGLDDDSYPDITYAGGVGRYFVCWEEYTSATNADVYMTSFTTLGSQGTSFGVEITNDNSVTPRLAYVGANDRILVVASLRASGSHAITGQLVNAATSTLVGPRFFVSTTGSLKLEPDVGGTNRTSTTNTHFLVAWSRQLSSFTRSIEYRVIDWTGSAVSGVVSVVSNGNEVAMTPAVSESHGDANLSGDWWTLAWIRDETGGIVGRGSVWARRVAWNGSTGLGLGNLLVDPNQTCTQPTVTSRLDDAMGINGGRPSIVAYACGFDRSIFARVFDGVQAYSLNAVSDVLEDFDGQLHQYSPSIGTDGEGFVLTYSEDYWNSTLADADMYMVSGHVSQEGNDLVIGLAERHQNMAFTNRFEGLGRVAMIQDGNNATTSDDGACIWMASANTNGGQLRGYTVDINTIDVLPERAVGIQYCDANPNSVGSGGGRNSSWLWIRGDQQRSSNHMAHCVDMPPSSFAFLICSLSTANVNMPGNTIGRLCVGGSVGRFPNIVSSGTSGEITTDFSPLSLPQPNGTVAAEAGQSWYFQVWHRDIFQQTVATSNFSNACRVTFTN